MTDENRNERSEVPLGELPTDVMWRMALDGTIEFVSSEVYEVRGISAEEAKAQMLEQILTPESAINSAAYMQALAEAASKGEELIPFTGFLTYLRADGSTYECEVQAVPQVGEDGTVKLLGISRGLIT
ncbi:MAG: PAS domain-containing protein [Candidatus Nanopelagicales bacterium]|jgi:PAS domain S-box-containing protein|nr:PAS domain-containing protein [Candidatus Nanopelagicales bacterium]